MRASNTPSSSLGAPPYKKSVRWAASLATPPSTATGPAHRVQRSLEAELNAGETPSSNPELYSAMMEARNVFTPMSKEQIDRKTREMRNTLSAKNRR